MAPYLNGAYGKIRIGLSNNGLALKRWTDPVYLGIVSILDRKINIRFGDVEKEKKETNDSAK